MALAQNRLVEGVWSRLRTKVGVRFTRFVGVAVASLGATEIALTICHGVFRLTPGPATIVSWFAGAVVSYVLSRWAWERRGKPHLLKETLPFWLIAAGTVVVLSAATSLAQHLALWWGLDQFERLAFVGAAYLAANAVTFLTRFLIFHYVLFADRGSAARPSAAAPEPGARSADAVPADDDSAGAGPAVPPAPPLADGDDADVFSGTRTRL